MCPGVVATAMARAVAGPTAKDKMRRQTHFYPDQLHMHVLLLLLLEFKILPLDICFIIFM